jgi:2-C-methyl-D-erythritol 4-phosphate cytidylyltransferase
MNRNKNYAVILAGGAGVRMNSAGVPKQFIELTGVPMLVYSMRTAQLNENIDEICVVTNPLSYEKVKGWASEHGITKLKHFAEAGKERQQSVYNGLASIPASENDIVMIMTSVCPFVSQVTINKHFEMLQKHKACITVVKATDAITFSNDGKHVNRTLQKKKMFVQQGPQTYRYGIIRMGHDVYMKDEGRQEVNEDSELVLNIGVEVVMVLGDRFCIKVTYPEDLAIAEALIGLFEKKEGKIQ